MRIAVSGTDEHHIDYTEENRKYRTQSDLFFRQLYRDEAYDLFPGFGQPKIIELWADRTSRISKLAPYL